jgi:hypothetical protein
MRRRSAFAAAAAASSLGLAACGGDTLSRQELTTKADAICQRAKAELQKLDEPKTIGDVKQLADAAVEVNERAAKDLKALEPPDAVAADYAKAMKNIDKQTDLARRLGTAAEKQDTAGIQRIAADGQRLDAEGDRLAKNIGLKECGT